MVKITNIFFIIDRFILKIFFLFLIKFISYQQEKYLNIDLIKVAYYCISFKNSGVERVISLLMNMISKEKILFNI